MPRTRKIRRRKLNSAARSAMRMDSELEASLSSKSTASGKPGASRIVLIGGHVFNARLRKLISADPGLEVVAAASTPLEGFAFPREFGAELVIVDVDFEGPGKGAVIARDINEKSPGTAFMLVCGHLSRAVAKFLWVYAIDSWSIVSNATAKNPGQMAEAIGSAVHGIRWVEPGVEREMEMVGPRPRSLAERKLTMAERARQRAS